MIFEPPIAYHKGMMKDPLGFSATDSDVLTRDAARPQYRPAVAEMASAQLSPKEQAYRGSLERLAGKGRIPTAP